MYHWGANADAQIFLTKRKMFSSFIRRFREKQNNAVLGNKDRGLAEEYAFLLDLEGIKD